MTALGIADLVVIAGQVLGIGTDAALAQIDVPTAQAALAEASLTGHGLGEPLSGPADAAAAWTRLVHALLSHHPFPAHHQQVAVAAGLQFLSVNGWRADLEPGTAAIVVEGLATGRLSLAAAAAWLAPRLSPYRAPRAKEGLVRALQRALRPMLPLRRGGAGMFADGRMLARFTGHATTAIALAQREARRLGHGHIDPEHILLGLIGQSDDVAVHALERLGIDFAGLRRQLEHSLGRGQEAPAGPVRPSRPRGQKVLDSSLAEALAHGHTDGHGCVCIGPEHLLLAQFHDGGAAAQALAKLGASESGVRGAITAAAAG